MEARGPGDAVRGRPRVPLQPVRPDQGLAALGLSGDRGRPHGSRPQSRTTSSPKSSSLGFSPANLVPGIGLSPDKMLMGRIFSYHDTHLHRIGANYEQLPINSPKVEVHSYNFDGPMTYIHKPATSRSTRRTRRAGPEADGENGADLGWDGSDGGELGRYENPEARRGRRLRPGRDAGAGDHGRRSAHGAGGERRRPRQRRGDRVRPRSGWSSTGPRSTPRSARRIAKRAGAEAEQAETPPAGRDVPRSV